jgi:hypoxanthine phosphoribosyltransferase
MLPSGERFRCQILSWSSVVKDAKRLSWIIKDSGYVPDIVIAIGRGGYVPARILCDYLTIHDLAAFKAEHWGIAAIRKKKAVIKFPLSANIKNKRVLLVDDITDTGETLRVSLQYLIGFEPKEVRTAVLIHKTCSKVVPDYFLRKIIKWRWVIFPWHLWEDMTGFITTLTDEGIRRENDIKRELRGRYGINVRSDMLREILSCLG